MSAVTHHMNDTERLTATKLTAYIYAHYDNTSVNSKEEHLLYVQWYESIGVNRS